MRIHHWASSILVLAITAVLVLGCANAGIIEDQATVRKLGDDPDRTVVVWHTYSEEESRVFEQEVVPEFEREYPHIHIEAVHQEHNQEYRAALIARASAERPPDVIRMDTKWVPSFAYLGLLHPLSDFPDYKEVAGWLREDTLGASPKDGAVYGLPLNINTKAAIYNRELMEKAGLEPSRASLADVFEAAKRHGYIVGMSGLEIWQSLPYFFGLGGKLSDEGFTRTSGYFNSDESVRAMHSLLELYHAGTINPKLLTGGADLWNEVYAGEQLLMIDDGPWYYSILLHAASLEEVDLLKDTVPAPFPTGGAYGSIIGGENLVLTKGSKVKDEAWTFIRFMMRKETQSKMFEAGLIPSNMEAFRDSGPIRAENPYINAYMRGIEDAFHRPAIPQWEDIEQIYDDSMEEIFINGRDVRETLDEASALMDAKLGVK
jgi:multiple sugar transport system substrate-binding protein